MSIATYTEYSEFFQHPDSKPKPHKHVFHCKPCGVTWRSENTSSSCWNCNAKHKNNWTV